MSTGAPLGLMLGCGLLLILTALTSERASSRAHRRRARASLASRAGLPWLKSSHVALLAAAGCCVFGVTALLISGLAVVGVLAATVGTALPVALLRRRAVRLRREAQAAWPDAVDALVSGIRAGMSLPEALGSLAERGPASLAGAFGWFAAEYRATGSFADALDGLERRMADPVADRVVASLRIAREVGGCDIGIVLRTLSGMLREEARMRGEIAGRQSWTVSAARMAVAAPWITLALLCTRPEAGHAYRSAAGAGVLLAAAAISAVAYRLMMRIGRLPAEQRLVS
jgi:tight adherence protein B